MIRFIKKIWQGLLMNRTVMAKENQGGINESPLPASPGSGLPEGTLPFM